MAEEMTPAPGFSLSVLSRTDEQLVKEARYAGGGSSPPSHFHPAQEERFEVPEGTMRARVDATETGLSAGEVLDVSRGTSHQLWNEGQEPAAVRRVTAPAGRTLEFFRELAAISGGTGEKDPATLLERYSDVLGLPEG